MVKDNRVYKFKNGTRVYYFNGHNELMSGKIIKPIKMFAGKHYNIERDKQYKIIHPRIPYGYTEDFASEERIDLYTRNGLKNVRFFATIFLSALLADERKNYLGKTKWLSDAKRKALSVRHKI